MELQIPEAFGFLFEGEARYRAAFGGRGSAKSRSFATGCIVRAYHRPTRILCCREVQNSIKDSVKRSLDDRIIDYGLDKFFESTEKEIRGQNGSLIVFAGLRTNPESVKSAEGLNLAWVEEANTVSNRSLELLTPTIREPKSEIWFTWNPRNPNDPVDAMFRAGEPPPRSLVREVNYEDNPWFPEVLREEMEWDRSHDPEKYAHVWKGAYLSKSEARVFRNWRIGTLEIPKEARPYFGADWGFAVDPTVLVRCWVWSRTLYVDREIYRIGCEIDRLPELFKGINDERVPDVTRWPIIADSARPETISYMQRHGFPLVESARKGPSSVDDGVEFIKSYDVVIHPECKRTSDEFTMYSYKTDKLTDEVLPILDDRSNHCVAEGELVETKRGLIAIERVASGDEVRTRWGWRRVAASWKTSNDREVMQITAGSRKVWVTPDHEIFIVGKDWTRADAIGYGDECIISVGVGEWLRLKLANIAEGFTGAILEVRGLLIEAILGLLTGSAHAHCTVTCGKMKTGQFRPDSMSTIKTAIRAITNSKISNVYPRPIIYPRMAKSDGRTQQLLLLSSTILKRSDRFQKHGIAAQRGCENIVRLAAFPINILSRFQSHVATVVFSLTHARPAIEIYFVQMLVNQPIVARSVSIISKAAVNLVELFLCITNMSRRKLVRAHVQIGTERRKSAVYDLTVDEHHEFIAGGIVVSNCVDSVRYALEKVRRPGVFAATGTFRRV